MLHTLFAVICKAMAEVESTACSRVHGAAVLSLLFLFFAYLMRMPLPSSGGDGGGAKADLFRLSRVVSEQTRQNALL